MTQYAYDANRHLIRETDPLNRATLYEWCTCGQMVKLTDPKGNLTQWHHDLQGRVTQKAVCRRHKDPLQLWSGSRALELGHRP